MSQDPVLCLHCRRLHCVDAWLGATKNNKPNELHCEHHGVLSACFDASDHFDFPRRHLEGITVVPATGKTSATDAAEKMLGKVRFRYLQARIQDTIARLSMVS